MRSVIKLITVAIAVYCVIHFSPASIKSNLVVLGGARNELWVFLHFLLFFSLCWYLALLLLKNRRAIINHLRSHYKNYLLLCVAVIVSLLCAEIILRITVQAIKTLPHYCRGYEFSYRYRKNAQGFRDDEFTQAKAKGIFRIFLIGDSFVEGIVDEKHTFDKLLEKKCKEDGFNCEVYNLGISGKGPSGYWLIAQQFKSYNPDLVIVSVYVNNDIERILRFKTQKTNILARSFKKITVWLENNSALLKSTKEFFEKKSMHSYIKKIPIDYFYKELAYKDQINFWLLVFGQVGGVQEHYDAIVAQFYREPVFRNHILAIKKLYDGVPFLLLIIPSKFQVNVKYFDDMKKIGFTFKENKIIDRKIQDAIIKWCVDNGIDYFDILPAILASPANDSFFYRLDEHYNAQGNLFVIDKIYNYLKQRGILAAND